MGGTAVQKVDAAVSVSVAWIILAFSIRDILLRAASQKHNRVKNVLSAPGFAASLCVFITGKPTCQKVTPWAKSKGDICGTANYTLVVVFKGLKIDGS